MFKLGACMEQENAEKFVPKREEKLNNCGPLGNSLVEWIMRRVCESVITRTKFSPTSSSRIYRILGFVSLDNSPGCPPDPKFSRGFVRPFPSFVPLEIRPDGICISTDISYVSIEITLIEQLDFQCTRAPRKRLNAAIQPTTKRRNTTGNDWSNTRVCVCYIGVAIDTIRFELDSSWTLV